MLKNRLKFLLLSIPGFEACCRQLTRGHVRALMYHRFAPAPGGDPRAVTAAELERQVARITRHHDLWTPDDHLDHLKGLRRAGRAPVVITVDDGYADFHDVAFPIFAHASVPAMLFVATGFIDGDTWMWWDRLRHLLAAAPGWRGSVDAGGRHYSLDLTTAAGREAAWNSLADRCRFLPDREKEQVIIAVAAALGVAPAARPPAGCAPVTWDQIRAMARAGMLFGAHTVTHPILTRLAPADAAAEIAGSGRRLAAELGAPVAWFCYPQGGPADFDATVARAVSDAGYRGAYVAYQNLSRPPDPWALPRYCVARDVREFRWMLCGAEWLVLRLRQRLGRPVAAGSNYWAGAD